MPETTEAQVPEVPEPQTEQPTEGVGYPTPPLGPVGVTSFSHEVQSASPAEFVFDPIREAENLREIMKGVEIRARDFAAKIKAYEGEVYDKGEVIANSILAIRHIEDARMRFGKVIQYAPVEKQGESCYTK